MRRRARLAFALLFVAALGGGAAASFARMAADGSVPALSWRGRVWRQFPPRFETALTDHLAGRGALLGLHARLRVDGLGASSSPRVWLGPDGWLFYNHWADVDPARRTAAALDKAVAHWGALGRARREWCAARGIALLIVVVPDKHSVYPELLPPAVRDKPDARVLDRVLEVWRAAPAVPVLDLRPGLRAAKADAPVYYTADTHWTPIGCYHGYARTAAALAAVLPGPGPTPLAALDLVPDRRAPGDLWRLLGKSGDPPAEACLVPRPRDPRTRRTEERVAVPAEDRLTHLDPAVWERDAAGPRVVLFHDSFAADLYQALLAEHCGRLVAVPSYQLVEAVVERERPAVVVVELAERGLVMLAPRPPRVTP